MAMLNNQRVPKKKWFTERQFALLHVPIQGLQAARRAAEMMVLPGKIVI